MKKYVLVILLAICQIALAGDFEDAEKAYEKKDYETAFKKFQVEAVKGNAIVQYKLGSMYHYGRGVVQDYNEAVRWYRLAAEQGYAGAQYGLGWMYSNGRGLAQSDKEAVRWYRLAAEQGFAEAQKELSQIYYSGRGVVRDNEEAARWYRLAAEQRNENFYIETKTQRDGRIIGEEATNLCSKIEYKEIYKKTTCDSSSLTLEQLTDNTKINEIQKIQLFNYIKERALLNSKIIENYKRGGKLEKRIGDYVSLVYYPAVEALMIDLYKGKLSWGDFNQNTKTLTLQFQAEQKRYSEELNTEIEARNKENKERYTKLIEGQRITEQQKSQREIEDKQREANANAQAARESQCRFRQAAEYAKPVPGGFFQSMQNANSVFDNCMAGVPQMNTTCSKDFTGQINCVTQ